MAAGTETGPLVPIFRTHYRRFERWEAAPRRPAGRASGERVPARHGRRWFSARPFSASSASESKTLAYSQIARAQRFDILQRWETADLLVRTNLPDSF